MVRCGARLLSTPTPHIFPHPRNQNVALFGALDYLALDLGQFTFLLRRQTDFGCSCHTITPFAAPLLYYLRFVSVKFRTIEPGPGSCPFDAGG